MKKIIGFIGQGWIGKNYADNFEERGFKVIRYAQESPYLDNKDLIKDCDIVFIAVPTPTTPQGFDDHIVREAVGLVGPGKIAVIKSTIVPGTTESIQAENPEVFVFHSPEFLTESMVKLDVKSPWHNIIGIPADNDLYRAKAEEVLAILPSARYATKICPAKEAEIFKYVRNCFFFTKVVFMNVLYDLAQKNDCRWETLRDIMAIDPWIGEMHIDPIHKTGRGAGGHCMIKDFAAMSETYRELLPEDSLGIKLLDSLRDKNISLLLTTGKDLDLLEGVYGQLVVDKPELEDVPGKSLITDQNETADTYAESRQV